MTDPFVDNKEEFYLHINPTFESEDTCSFETSSCQGKKKALLIGINYMGADDENIELSGCIDDVENIKEFLISMYNFEEKNMTILTDDFPRHSKFYPSRENILDAMRCLVEDAQPNDSLFLHYSGHGSRVKDLDGDEEDGYDETILPADFREFEGTSGHILDDTMHDILVKPLCKGCRLTCIFDTCHSGTALDLPFIYSTKGVLKEHNLFKMAGKGFVSIGKLIVSGDMSNAYSDLIELVKGLLKVREIERENRQNKFSPADVIMLSGCKDDETSTGFSKIGRQGGAMSYAFITSLRQDPNQSYEVLLKNLRKILTLRYSQRPQLSASHPIDVKHQFVC
ncbi:hypothetical protein RO3G_14921 [Rhizopus delemar RA 99-880]|uniref:Peptidase C14 caspase domain-containing protein n=1 Tax=Rhizopus delemar (strain RA 99-880 / ATCC MYA-4621 / FGSC 9543 / NRRL 43880) TaxID=246409 RepID=I1CP30_RHIO9|nr:hypothetical protein RO3G_14921 [Rhizopus delemar RA 99-880]|eukprot:EIE90210.1 hypothetical protein RO3G_14921 [Rhizopus delemar RA 99-880]